MGKACMRYVNFEIHTWFSVVEKHMQTHSRQIVV